jgi:hypothetical protein
MSEVGKTSGQGGNIARVIGRLALLIKAAGDRLFQAEDERARQYGWQTTVRCGGLGRGYRDPRFSRFRSCPACGGTGIGPADKPFDAGRREAGIMAAACMAKDLKVSQHARYAHLIALDVIRRELPAEWTGHPWYDTGTADGSPTIPGPREPAHDDYWLGEQPSEQPSRWIPA